MFMKNDKVGFCAVWETKTNITSQDWRIGDKKEMPTMFGKSIFTLTEKTPEKLTWMSGDLMMFWNREGEDWVWNHVIIDARAVARVVLVV